jgi:chaperone modulatory protein CbpM
MQQEFIHHAELIGEGAFSAEELARACGVTVTWVQARVESGVLDADSPAEGRYGNTALARARRIARLEACFDADPQLAALTADLMEEVMRLRRRLHALGLES